MVRAISDLGKKSEYRHAMGSIADGLNKVGAERGGYFRGLGPSILRAAVLNATLIGPYDYIKERMYTTFGDVWPNKVAYFMNKIVLFSEHQSLELSTHCQSIT